MQYPEVRNKIRYKILYPTLTSVLLYFLGFFSSGTTDPRDKRLRDTRIAITYDREERNYRGSGSRLKNRPTNEIHRPCFLQCETRNRGTSTDAETIFKRIRTLKRMQNAGGIARGKIRRNVIKLRVTLPARGIKGKRFRFASTNSVLFLRGGIYHHACNNLLKPSVRWKGLRLDASLRNLRNYSGKFIFNSIIICGNDWRTLLEIVISKYLSLNESTCRGIFINNAI